MPAEREAESERAHEAWARDLWEVGEAKGQFGEVVRFCNGMLLQSVERGATHLRITSSQIEQRIAGQWGACTVGRGLDGRCSSQQARWRLKQMSELPIGPAEGEAQVGKVVIVFEPPAAPGTRHGAVYFVTHARSDSGSTLLLERYPGISVFDPWPVGLGDLLAKGSRAGEAGHGAEARRILEDALRVVERSPRCEPSALLATLFRLASALEDQGADAEAEVVFRRWLGCSAQVGDESHAHAGALTSLGRLLIDRGQLDEAGRLLTRAREIDAALWGAGHSLRWADRELARLYRAQGDLERSRSAGAATLAHCESLGLGALICHVSRDLGLLEQASGHLEAAAGHFQRALQAAGSLGRPLPLLVASLQRDLARTGAVQEASTKLD